MKRFMLTVAFTAAALPACAQEDTVRMRDGKTHVGRLISAAADFVKLEPSDTQVPIDLKSEEVAEVALDRSNLPSSYFKAETAQRKGNYDEAIKFYGLAAAETGAPAYMKQFALFEIADCYRTQGKMAEWEKALDDLRAKVPETYFLWTIFWDVSGYHVSKKDAAKADKIIKDFNAAASKYPNWSGGAKFRLAQLSHTQGKYDDALKYYGGLKGDKIVGEDAKVYELRCMVDKGDAGGARARGEALLKSTETSARVLTAAYNSIGDALLKDGNLKEAMKAYLRGITEYERSAAGSDMHEYALAYSAISMKKYADSLPDATKKADYTGKALGLQKELSGRYPGSPLIAKVADALK